MTEFLMIVLDLSPLDVLPDLPTPTPTSADHPRQSQGFAAYVVGGFFALGILVFAMVLLNRRPRRISPRPPDERGHRFDEPWQG
jgi:hypothetical protein